MIEKWEFPRYPTLFERMLQRIEECEFAIKTNRPHLGEGPNGLDRKKLWEKEIQLAEDNYQKTESLTAWNSLR